MCINYSDCLLKARCSTIYSAAVVYSGFYCILYHCKYVPSSNNSENHWYIYMGYHQYTVWVVLVYVQFVV